MKGCILRPLRFLCPLCVLCILSCKPGVPSHIIQPDDMEDILFDYHIAEAMTVTDDGDARQYNNRLYRLAVLKKHGVSQADFDSSMVYYTRHADRLHAIYQNLAQRMADEALAWGADAGNINTVSFAEGDTTNIWTLDNNLVLFPHPPYNMVSFFTQADSTYRKGDRFIMIFNTRFLYQDGVKDGMAQMAVRFDNDSVGVRIMRMSTDSPFRLEMPNNDSLGIKSVRAVFYLGRDQYSTSTTMKMMMLNNIRLVRCHPVKKEKEEPQPQQPERRTPSPVSLPVDSDSAQHPKPQKAAP